MAHRRNGGKVPSVIVDPLICNGKPVLEGTRIPVHIVLDLLAAGEDARGIRRAYPQLTEAHIRACLHYAAELADEEAGVVTK
jgi:uncharacterized protein (DUF433 family)